LFRLEYPIDKLILDPIFLLNSKISRDANPDIDIIDRYRAEILKRSRTWIWWRTAYLNQAI
jgi:hypothetical protein